MALAGCVFDQDDLAGADMTRLAVASGDRNTARQTDHILPSGRSVPAVFIVGGGFAEHDAARRQAFRQLARGRLLDPVDLDVAEMRLAIGILVKIVDTHRSTLLYLPTIPGFGPRAPNPRLASTHSTVIVGIVPNFAWRFPSAASSQR